MNADFGVDGISMRQSLPCSGRPNVSGHEWLSWISETTNPNISLVPHQYGLFNNDYRYPYYCKYCKLIKYN